ncbi:MAG: helix-turn-helix transcriptional regulator [Lachnospiraceae bacterium]|nr:helix-turn-helix transcriptional regulator [Lachnospiraceae bacterium]
MSDVDSRKVFADNLKFYMKLRGKNQSDLMKELKISSSTLSNWCTGLKMPRMDKVQLLADFFGIEKSDLIDSREGRTEPDTYILDPDEIELLSNYQRLDKKGKHLLLERSHELVKLGFLADSDRDPREIGKVAETPPYTHMNNS